MNDLSERYATSTDLYAACKSTDAQVQAPAYEVLWHYLYRVALQVVYDQPDPEALAQDCAQVALIRAHERMSECTEPAAFLAWTRRIVANVSIDELRRRKRLVPFEDDDEHAPDDAPGPVPHRWAQEAAEPALGEMSLAELRAVILRAPISARSSRVVVGRYLDNLPDEALARVESGLAGQTVLPSHIQVTRTKDITRLRAWEPLRAFLKA